MGNIGQPLRKREYEPMPQTEPVHEPAAPKAPVRPIKEPQHAHA